MSWIDWIVTLVPFGLIMAAAIYSGKYVRGVADFLAAGRCAGRYVMCVGDVTAGLSIISLIASVEQSYRVGYALGFWHIINAPIGIFVALTGFCIYRYRATRALSFGQFLEMRYNRTVRIVAATIRNIAEMVTNAIGPAIAAGFFIYFLGLPHRFQLWGMNIPTAAIVIGICLFLAVICIWPGGRVSLLVTDCAQGILCYPIFVIITVFVLCRFSWFDEIAPVLMDRVPNQSFLNPFDIKEMRDFNLFSVGVAITGSILNRAAWFGNDTTNSGRTPHENKMAGILGSWRNGFAYTMLTVIAIMMIAFMNHQKYAVESNDLRIQLTDRVTEELIADQAIRNKINNAVSTIKPQVHVIGKDTPLSQKQNLETIYMDTVRGVLEEIPEGHALYDTRIQLFQRYKTSYNQMMTPVALRTIFPVGMGGLFCLLMLMLLISTDDSRIFNASSTIVQDCIMPFFKSGWTPKTHILILRLASVGVAIFFFIVAVFFQNMDYISMFTTIMCSLWLGGAGPIMIGGLYTRFGNTTGAVCSLIFGSGTSLVGLIMQRNWADHIYPYLDRHDMVESWDKFLKACSSPFDPYIKWEMAAEKFPINSYEIYFISMVLSVIAYCLGSWITYKGPYNLDRLLHRGIYSTGESKQEEKPSWTARSIFARLIGIDAEYTTGDKVIAWSVFLYTFGYSITLMFLVPFIWNMIAPWPIEWWSYYFFIGHLCVGVLIGCISTVWFMWGGIRDGKQLFIDLANRMDDKLDNGVVSGNVSLADAKHFSDVEHDVAKEHPEAQSDKK